MERHLRTLAILHMVYGGLVILWGISSLWAVSHLGILVDRAPVHIGHLNILNFDLLILPLWAALVFATGVFGTAALVGGWGLYNFKNWGRLVVLVVGLLALVRFPLGTALGIYTLYVLMKPEAARLTRG